MAVTALNLGYTPSKGVDYTHTTDSSADWAAVANSTKFLDLTDNVVYFKDDVGEVNEVFGQSIISLTYAALKALYDAGTMRRGYYEINDFATIYTRPDFDGAGAPKAAGSLVTVTAATEPIIVFAESGGVLNPNAWQAAYPLDKIKYDIDWVVTDVKGDPAKGRITERINQYNTRMDYDFQTVLFKRYETAPASGIFTIINDNGGASQLFPTFTVALPILLADNYFDDTANLIPLVFGGTYPILSNNVFNGQGILGNRFDALFGNNTWWDTSFSTSFQGNKLGGDNNIMLADFNNNRFIGYGNLMSGDFEHNDVRQFSGNIVTNQFISNIGENVKDNTFNGDVHDNNFGEDFGDDYMGTGGNVCGINFFDNTFHASQYRNNDFGDDFRRNVILGQFDGNTIGTGCNDNIFESEFNTNVVGDSYQRNKTGFQFRNNTIGTDFEDNIVEQGFDGNTISNFFRFNKVSALSSNGVDYTVGATHVYNAYDCHIFRRSDGASRLQYYLLDVPTVVLPTA